LTAKEESIMTESEIRNNDSQANKNPNYLLYETPRLRKHGRVCDVTKFLFPGPVFDGFPLRTDVSYGKVSGSENSDLTVKIYLHREFDSSGFRLIRKTNL
jgi:hypothetical protein